jgi:hypothetical protein
MAKFILKQTMILAVLAFFCVAGAPSAKAVAGGGPCTSFTYSDWGVCQGNNIQTRTAAGQPAGCSGVPNEALQRTCPICTSFTYSPWSACNVSSLQTRTVTATGPQGCSGGQPGLLSKACAYASTASPDAIAVRIIPNPNHYSIERWYESQGFKGSPQALTVDGYSAIRDGRTVYVNAANIDPASNELYTNIYLLSYNQDSDTQTVDIFGKIIDHWKFNNNLSSQSGVCSISTLNCASSSDCSDASYTCAGGKCLATTAVNCSIDSECPSGFFCDGQKAKVIRDLKRLEAMSEIKDALSSYHDANGRFPILPAGTYLTDVALSVWPSWSGFLSQTFGLPALIDPINNLGNCAGYDLNTCWNDGSHRFYNNGSSQNLVLPANSYALVYLTKNSGLNYSLCAKMETAYSLGQGVTLTNSSCQTVTSNNGTGQVGADRPPYFEEYSLQGESGKEFNGSIRAFDPDGDPLSWTINTIGLTWPKLPVLVDTGISNQKKVWSAQAPGQGTYNFSITINDGKGGVVTQPFAITITNPAPKIIAEDINYDLNDGLPFDYSLYIEDNNQVTDPDVTCSPQLSFAYSVNSTREFKQLAPGRYSLHLHGYLSDSLLATFTENKQMRCTVSTTNSYGAQATKDFNINIKVKPLLVSYECPKFLRVKTPYTCNFSSNDQTLKYGFSGLPGGLTGSDAGVISGSVDDIVKAGKYTVNISATSSVNSTFKSTYPLTVNTWCGDDAIETPNSEASGGVSNNGVEQCDTNQGVATSARASSAILQYGCTNCVRSGGWCNDTVCAGKYEGYNNGWLGYDSAHPDPTPDQAKTLLASLGQTGFFALDSMDKCPQDCPYCGDGICGPENTKFTIDDKAEGYNKCKSDCPYCGDGIYGPEDNKWAIDNVEQCEQMKTITPQESQAPNPDAPEGTTERRGTQYCNTLSCQQDMGYCGDGTVQTLDTPGLWMTKSEECDPASTDQTVNPDKNHSSAANKYCATIDKPTKCLKNDGYCGDAIIQASHNETCDSTSRGATSASNGYCYSTGGADPCTPSAGYCGDGILQNAATSGSTLQEPADGWEKCDGTAGVATSAADSSPDKQYGCTSDCAPTGGYNGDGVCSGSKGENCYNDFADCGGCIARIRTSADNEHISYFDGTELIRGSNWRQVDYSPAKSVPRGNHVYAVFAHDNGGVYGFSSELILGPIEDPYVSMNTNNLNGWDCTKAVGSPYNNNGGSISSTYDPSDELIDANGHRWVDPGFSSAAWPTPVNTRGECYVNASGGGCTDATRTLAYTDVDGTQYCCIPGNTLPFKQIWSSDAQTNNTAIYCRYTFSY